MTQRSSAERRALELRRSADILDRLENYEPVSLDELREQTFFFLMRAVRKDGLDRSGADLERALALLGRAGPALARGCEARVPDPRSLRGSDERVSIIGTDFRYIDTSDVNAGFYRTGRDGLVGRHVGDLIGAGRFERRARRHLELCFRGGSQEYYHGLSEVDGERIMRCQMKPARDGEGRPTALVYMRDVTDDLPTIFAAAD